MSNHNLHVSKTNFQIKGFALGLTLEQRWKAIRKSTIEEDKRTVHEYSTLKILFHIDLKAYGESLLRSIMRMFLSEKVIN